MQQLETSNFSKPQDPAMNQLITTIENIASVVESGQAEKPLTSEVELIRLQNEGSALIVCKNCDQQAYFFENVTELAQSKISMELIEKLLGDGNITLQVKFHSGIGFRFEGLFFEEEAQLIAHLGSTSFSGCETYSITLPARQPLINFIISPIFKYFLNDPILQSKIVTLSGWLFTFNHELNVDETRLLQLLSSSLPGITTIKKIDDESLYSLSNEVGSNLFIAQPICFQQNTVKLRGLLSQNSKLADITLSWLNYRKIKQLYTLLIDELEQKGQRLKNQQRLQNQGVSNQKSQSSDLRELQESLRVLISDHFENLQKDMELAANTSLKPGGEIYRVINDLTADIETSDVDQTPTHDKIKLSLLPEKQEVFIYSIRDHGSRLLAQDIEKCKQATHYLQEQVKNSLANANVVFPQITLTPPEQPELSQAIGALSHPEIKYRGEMPKPTVFTRLGEARGSIMGLMFLAMLGTAAMQFSGASNQDTQEFRVILSVLMIPALVFAFLWTWFSQKKKDDTYLEREVDRIRDGVAQEMRRTISDISRHTNTLFNNFFQKTSRDLINAIGQQIRQEEGRKQQEIEQKKQLAQEGSRTIEQKIRLLEQQKNELARSQMKIKDLDRIIRDKAFKYDS